MKYLLTNGNVVNTKEEAMGTPFGYCQISDEEAESFINFKKVLDKPNSIGYNTNRK